MYGIIYKVSNNINKKIYIGQTIQKLNRRKCQHKCDSIRRNDNYFFNNSLKKYGFENFEWDILEECETKEILNCREIYWIEFFDASNKNKGYNIRLGGDGGGHLSEKTKEKISLKKKGVHLTEEHKDKIRKGVMGEKNPFFGKKHTKESKDIISKKSATQFKGKHHTEKSKEILRQKNLGENNPMYGKTWSKELREKIMKNRENIIHYKSKQINIMYDNITINFKNIRCASEFLQINYAKLRYLLNKNNEIFIDKYQIIKS